MKVQFSSYDQQVIDAIDSANTDGLVTTWELRWRIPGLPAQRLSGMERRGLLYHNGREWAVMEKAREQSEAYQRRTSLADAEAERLADYIETILPGPWA